VGRRCFFAEWFFDSVDEGVGEAEFAAEGGFAGGHLAVVGLVVKAGEVEETVEEEDSYLVAQGVAVGYGLAGGGLERDGEVAGVVVRDFSGGWETEDVGGFVFAAKRSVEASEGGVVGEQDFDFAGESDGRASTVEEAGQARAGQSFKAGKWLDRNHWIGFDPLGDDVG
jgi:hypothetical protein